MSLDLNAEYEQDRIKELILLLLLFSGSSKPVTIPEVASKNRKRNPKKKEEDSVVWTLDSWIVWGLQRKEMRHLVAS